MKHLNRNILLLQLLFISIPTLSQEEEIDKIIEFVVQEQTTEEESENVDLIPLRDELENIYAHPININSKHLERLAEIGIISYNQLSAIREYILNNGNIIALEELGQIQELDYELIRTLKPFIQFDGITEAQKTSLNKITSQSKYDLTFHYQQVLQKSKAYNSIEPIYLGNPMRLMFKFSMKFYKKWKLGINIEKDAGEAIYWDFNERNYGFDHNSGYLAYQGDGVLKSAIIGDFQCGFGQGLTFWRGFSFNKSSNSVSIRKVNSGIRPHTGLDEYNFLRGIALHLSKGRFSLSSIFSLRNIDANQRDSSYSAFSSIIKSGYHRSLNERSKSSKIKEIITIGHLAYNADKWNIGLSYVYQTLSSKLHPNHSLPTIYQFSGSRNSTIGLNSDYQLKNGHAFCEISLSSNSAASYLVGLVLSPDPKLSISLLNRGYSKNYQSVSSSAFGESSNNQNENGLYSGLEFKISRKLSLNAYYDIFQFNWLQSRSPFLTSGSEFLMKLNYSKSKKQSFSVRYRLKKDEFKNQLSNGLEAKYRHQLRLDYSQNINSMIKMHYRLEVHKVKLIEWKTGYSFFVDFIIQSPEKPYSISARYVLFNTDDYDTRIYAYERDVYFSYSIRPYFYQGQKIYINLKWRMRRFFTFSFRFSHTNYPYLQQVGSGNDEIAGNKKSEITFQLRIRW